MPVFEKETSKIKMVILTKTKENNAVWWSPINQNKRRNELIIKGMIRRFKNNEIIKITNVIQFYEKGILIAQHRL